MALGSSYNPYNGMQMAPGMYYSGVNNWQVMYDHGYPQSYPQYQMAYTNVAPQKDEKKEKLLRLIAHYYHARK